MSAYVVRSHEREANGQVGEAIGSAQRAVAVLEGIPHPPPRLTVNAYGRRGSALVVSGDAAGAADMTRALELAEKHQFTKHIIHTRLDLSEWHLLAHSASQSADELESALGLATRIGDPEASATMAAGLAESYAVLGRINDGLRCCAQFAEVVEEVNSALVLSYLNSMWGWLLTLKGNLDDARPRVLSAMRLAEASDRLIRANAVLVAAEWQVCARAEDPDFQGGWTPSSPSRRPECFAAGLGRRASSGRHGEIPALGGSRGELSGRLGLL